MSKHHNLPLITISMILLDIVHSLENLKKNGNINTMSDAEFDNLYKSAIEFAGNVQFAVVKERS